jgi:hypothetical protein
MNHPPLNTAKKESFYLPHQPPTANKWVRQTRAGLVHLTHQDKRSLCLGWGCFDLVGFGRLLKKNRAPV